MEISFSPEPFLEKQTDRNPERKGKVIVGEDEEEEKARCEWDFNLSSTVVSSSSAAIASSDAVGAIEFDPSDRHLATGGIARKIRIYSTEALSPPQEPNGCPTRLDSNGACERCICAPAKLSSLKWRPDSGGRVIGSGDYDGGVLEYDIERGMPVFERDEHGGRCVWSVDYSGWCPVLGASGSDDGTMQMWDTRCSAGTGVATVRPGGPRSSVCCVQFNPFGGALVVAGSTDRKAYGYDVRMMSGPVLVFDGHRKPVTYVRFLDFHSITTAGIDGCLKLWNIELSGLIRTYRGHANTRNFVGLSVWRNGGLLGCGSENNQVFVYDKRWGEPIWVHGFGPEGGSEFGHGFVSGVCWRQEGEDECMLVAGRSDGALQAFVGQRRPGAVS